jgi:hypothetical protein
MAGASSFTKMVAITMETGKTIRCMVTASYIIVRANWLMTANGISINSMVMERSLMIRLQSWPRHSTTAISSCWMIIGSITKVIYGLFRKSCD